MGETQPALTIFQAFIRAQKAFGPALKTSTNPHFRSRYADLSACVEAVIDALNDNGLGLLQITHQSEGGVCVETVLVHESGDTLSSGMLHVPASKADAQGYGSALTYARRYSLMAICGIAPEDDDGNHAVKTYVKKKTNDEHFFINSSVEPLTFKPVAEPASPTSTESLTPSLANDPLPWQAPITEKKKLNKAVMTRYDVSGLPGQQLEKAQAYLTENLCKQVGDMLWECPIRLEKLTGCIVE